MAAQNVAGRCGEANNDLRVGAAADAADAAGCPREARSACGDREVEAFRVFRKEGNEGGDDAVRAEDRRVHDIARGGKVETKIVGMDEPAVATDAPAIMEKAARHGFAHRLAAEDKAFEADKSCITGEIHLKLAMETAAVEQDCLLRQPEQAPVDL